MEKIKSNFILSFLCVIFFEIVRDTLAKQNLENVIFGKCCTGRADIIYLVDTVHLCGDLCKERPVCTAISYHRQTTMCRLHTEECPEAVCAGFLYSKKEGWDMTKFNDCNCAAGKVCTQNGNTGQFDCEVKECRMPDKPANGVILGNDVRLTRRIRYRCNAGYVPVGELTRECQINGTWSGVEPQCKTVCPVVGSIKWGHSCYFIVTNTALKETFEEASSYCGMKGGHLAHVTSQVEHEFIASQLVKPTNIAATRYWIGVARNITDGNWYQTNSPAQIVYTNWNPGEPANGYDCAAYKYEGTVPTKWKWFAEPCTSLGFPLCEYDKNV